MAIPASSTVIEFLPNSPCVLERMVLPGTDATDALKRLLTRFGLAPHLVGYKKGDQDKRPDEILIMGRDRVTEQPVVIGRILWGIPWADLAEARAALIDEGWAPKPPKFDMELPDGRPV